MKNQNRCPLEAPVSLHAGRCDMGESVYNCVEITRCRSADSVYGAVGLAVYDCVGKVLHNADAARRISPVGGGLFDGETG